MTIGKFNEWGRMISRPEIILWCDSDKAVADIATQYQQRQVPIPHIGLSGGSLVKALGVSPLGLNSEVHELPIDLLHVTYRTTNHHLHESLVANSIVIRKRWWRGQILVITNGGFLGSFEIAQRAHPNDGVFDVTEVDARISYRQKLIARGRLARGAHVPHPMIGQRQSRSDSWIFAVPMGLYLDEVYRGRVTDLGVTLKPDVLKVVI